MSDELNHPCEHGRERDFCECCQAPNPCAELTHLRAENDALRAVLARIGDLDKRHAIARQCGLNEWADWAQNIARYAARAAIAKATGGNDE